MAKRFLDTEFFKKPLIRGFEGPYKLLYAFIICDCDNAGIWNPDFQIASIYVGSELSKGTAEKKLSGKFIELPNGQWFFPGFIKHQYPAGLQNSNPAHKKVIEKLKLFELIDNDLKIKELKGALKDLHSPSEEYPVGTMDMVEEEEEVKVVVKEKVVKQKLQTEKKVIMMPWPSEKFSESWARWKDYKKTQHNFKYKSEDSEQAALFDLAKLSKGQENIGIDIINQSIAKGWKGLFELKMISNESNTGNTTNNSGKLSPGAARFEAIKNY